MCPPDSVDEQSTPTTPIKVSRSRTDTDIARLRRRQIIDAARAIIAEHGIQGFSLDKVEKRANMSRGQLTYYFPYKEDVLLAVFDDMVAAMRQRVEDAQLQGEARDESCAGTHGGWELVQHILGHIVSGPPSPEFGTLQFAFLSQVSHREDFRLRLASLYETWRDHLAGELTKAWPGVSPKSAAVLVSAVFHGVIVQLTADPNAFDRADFLELCDRLVKLPKPSAVEKRTVRKAAAFQRRPALAGSQIGESPR